MDRRTFLLGSGTGVASSLGGCLTDETDSEQTPEMEDRRSSDNANSVFDTINQTNTTNQSEPETTIEDAILELVDPTVIETYATEPRLISMDEQSLGNRSEFSVTVQNTGIAGEIGVEFFWVKDLDEEWKGVENYGNRQKEGERIVYFNENERRSISFTGELPYGYEGYAFDLFRATFAADIRNNGGSGDVEVKLTNPDVMDAITDKKTVTFEEGETKRVEFVTDHPQMGDAFDIEVEPTY